MEQVEQEKVKSKVKNDESFTKGKKENVLILLTPNNTKCNP